MEQIHIIPEFAYDFHGHRCPYMPLGFMAGEYAMRLLGIERERDHKTFLFSEMGDDHLQGCFNDGLQAATGCTYGKQIFKLMNYGKAAAILYKPEKGAVRVIVNDDILKDLEKFKFFEYRYKGYEPSEIPLDVSNEVIGYLTSIPDEKLFRYEFLKDFTYTPLKKTSKKIECDDCHELVFENYIKIWKNKKLCTTCYEKERR
ncbi:FmdE family protein [Acidiplasma sp.]|uniref:FmdE family protein n=1 Tax=Acidiplasma sp. TaxID=1872114 RepID=UPI002587FDD3|nr:FmdE family protein [Acidiplasma sp.]